MPMDIRSFFKVTSKGGSGAEAKNNKNKKKKEEQPAAAPPPKASSGSGSGSGSTSRRKVGPAAASAASSGKQQQQQQQQQQQKTSKPNTTKKRIVIDDDDDDDDDDEEQAPEQRQVISIDDDDDDDDEKKKAASPSNKKRKPAAAKDDEDDDDDDVVEVTASSSSSSKLKPSPKKKLKSSSPPAAAAAEKTEDDNKKKNDHHRAPPGRSRKRESDSEYDEEEELVEISTKKASPPKRPKASTSSSASTSKTAKKTSTSTKAPPLVPQRRSAGPVDTDRVAPECLAGYTFVFSGILDKLGREESHELIKVLGGRVTTAVSSKTDYLVVGQILEDGRPYTEGSKYKKATEEKSKTIIVQGEEVLYGLIEQYDEKVRSRMEPAPAPAGASTSTSSKTTTAAAAAKPTVNPYAKVKSNPYAKRSSSSSFVPIAETNPYAKKAAAGAATTTAAADRKPRAIGNDNPNQLWVDKYKPASSRDILGNQESVRKLTAWLARWEDRFNNSQAVGKAFSSPQGPWKAALLSGPPGIGKTTTATIVAQEQGRDAIEFNASDVRSKKAIKDSMGDITGSRTIEFRTAGTGNKKSSAPTKRCIIMDEVDGMGAGDRSGMAELIQMIKNTRVPIICICNDRQSQKMKSLLPYCMDLRYKRPVKSTIATRAISIANKEGLSVEQNAAEAIVESCGNDIRQVINCLQMWASKDTGKSRVTYKDLKEREHSINKDEILRVGLFDGAKTILEGRRGLMNATPKQELNSFFRRNDAYYVDYNFMGLMVQQNYLKVVQGQFNEAKRGGDPAKLQGVLEQMHSSAESMSDFAHAENLLRKEQNWSLLPFTGVLAVKTGFHAGGQNGGFLAGYPEFSSWLGRNSSKGKKSRLLLELQHHTNYHISGGTEELRLSYLPVFRDRLFSAFDKEGGVDEAIRMMDEYGLDRDDVFEKLDEFVMDAKAPRFDKFDSRKKAAFTRAYNEGIHKSQALVAEQGGGKKVKRKASGVSETADPDTIDDDKVEQEEEDEEEELDAAKIQAMFKKSRRGGGGKAKGKAKPKAKASTAKGKKKK